jgi:GTPase
MKPIVAIVGRPNVGKSTLFNRLAQTRLAIIEDQPGVTRDRLYFDADWNGRTFTLVDTGGIQIDKEGDTIEAHVTRQAEVAIREADVIVFVVDGRQGVTPGDREVADLLRRTKKPVLLAVNKIENLKHEELAYEWYELGLSDPITVSALHGMGTGDLLDALVEQLPDRPEEEREEGVYRVAVIGRPNVGKSSLVNKLLGEDRVIVSDVAGTTRDAIDVHVERDGERFLFVDTAGMRRRGKVEEGVERYSVMRALRAVERCDVVLLLIDAADGVTDQDQKIAGYADENGKATIVVVNKWDLVEKDEKTMDRFRETVRTRLSFMDYFLQAFISAKTGQRVQRLFELVRQASVSHAKRISTGTLNDLIRESMLLNPPPSDKGRRLKIFYATQISVRPPSFLFFVNDTELLHFSYRRYLENKLRETFEFEGTPLRLFFRPREKEKLIERPGKIRRLVGAGLKKVIRRARRKGEHG